MYWRNANYLAQKLQVTPTLAVSSLVRPLRFPQKRFLCCYLLSYFSHCHHCDNNKRNQTPFLGTFHATMNHARKSATCARRSVCLRARSRDRLLIDPRVSQLAYYRSTTRPREFLVRSAGITRAPRARGPVSFSSERRLLVC